MAGQTANEDKPATRAEVKLRYTNHRGVTAWRRIWPLRIEHRTSRWHRGAQWLLIAQDLDKQEEREFAMLNIHGWSFPPPIRDLRRALPDLDPDPSATGGAR